MEILVIYDKRMEQSNMIAYLTKGYHTNGVDNLTLKEVSAISSANITTYCTTTLVDATYDYIFVSSLVGNTGTGQMTNIAFASLRAKLKTANQGTLIVTDTSPGGGVSSTTKLVLATYTGADDAYNGYTVEITAGTNSGLKTLITDSDLSDTNVEIAVAAGFAFDVTSVYSIYDVSDYLFKFDATVAGKTPVTQAWEALLPNVTIPLLFHYAGSYETLYTPGYGFAQEYGVSQGGGLSTTFVFAAAQGLAASATAAQRILNDYFNESYIYIIKGTGQGQYRQIPVTAGSYVGATLTATVAAWTTTPDNTSVYVVVRNLKEVWYCRATELMFRGTYTDPTDVTTYTNFMKMIDKGNKIHTRTSGTMEQDKDYLWNTFMPQAIAVIKDDMTH